MKVDDMRASPLSVRPRAHLARGALALPLIQREADALAGRLDDLHGPHLHSGPHAQEQGDGGAELQHVELIL